MILDGAKGKLRWVPAGFLLGKVGLTGAERRAYLAANRDVRRLGTAAIVGRYITDRMFRTLALRIAEARGDAPTWLYRFSWRSPNFGSAVHCVDVPFFFDCLDCRPRRRRSPATRRRRRSPTTCTAARSRSWPSGDPGWPRFTDAGGTARVYDVPSAVAADGYAAGAAHSSIADPAGRVPRTGYVTRGDTPSMLAT